MTEGLCPNTQLAPGTYAGTDGWGCFLLFLLPFLSLPSLLEVGPWNQIGGLGNAVSVPSGNGRSPGRKRIWCTLKLSESHRLQSFSVFWSWCLTKIIPRLTEFRGVAGCWGAVLTPHHLICVRPGWTVSETISFNHCSKRRSWWTYFWSGCSYVLRIQGGPKMAHFSCALTSYALTSSNIERFSNLFHFRNHENICNHTVTKDPTTPQLCRYTTLWNDSVLKATIENKTTSVTTYFKKLTTGKTCLLSQLLSKVSVASCTFTSNVQSINQSKHISIAPYVASESEVHVSALLLDNALLKCVVTEVVLFSIFALKTHWHFTR